MEKGLCRMEAPSSRFVRFILCSLAIGCSRRTERKFRRNFANLTLNFANGHSLCIGTFAWPHLRVFL